MSRKDLNVYEKAAVILLSLKREDAAMVMSHMQRDEVLKIASFMSSLGPVDLEVTQDIVELFVNDAEKLGGAISGDSCVTASILGAFLNASEVEEMLSKIKDNVWEALEVLNPQVLALYLSEEHPQTASLVLSKLSPAYTADVLSHVEESIASEIIDRMVNIGSISGDVLEQVEKCLKIELIQGVQKLESGKNIEKQLAQIFNNMSETDREKYMLLLSEKHPAICKTVKDLMFTFEHLIGLNPADIRVLVGAVDQADFLLALKGASTQLQEFFFENIANRLVDLIKEGWEIRGKIRISEVKAAQQNVLQVVKQLVSAGKINISQGDEEYL